MNQKIQKLQAQLEAEKLKEAMKDLGISLWSLAFLETDERIIETKIKKIIRYKNGNNPYILFDNEDDCYLDDSCTVSNWKLYVKCF